MLRAGHDCRQPLCPTAPAGPHSCSRNFHELMEHFRSLPSRPRSFSFALGPLGGSQRPSVRVVQLEGGRWPCPAHGPALSPADLGPSRSLAPRQRHQLPTRWLGLASRWGSRPAWLLKRCRRAILWAGLQLHGPSWEARHRGGSVPCRVCGRGGAGSRRALWAGSLARPLPGARRLPPHPGCLRSSPPSPSSPESKCFANTGVYLVGN